MITVQVDSYAFPPGGVIATVSPHLWITLETPRRRLHLMRDVDAWCPRCNKQLRAQGLKTGESVLRCRCLEVVFGQPFSQPQIIAAWHGLRRLKSQIAAQIAQPENN